MASNHGPFQFSVRGLLLTVTAACVVLGGLQWLLPHDVPMWMRVYPSVAMLAAVVYAFWIYYRGRSRPWRAPVDYVIVKVDAKWRRRIKSPWIMGPVAALTGVSLTFAPFYLFWCGPVEDLGAWEWLGVVASFLMIYIVPGFYMRLASEVMAELLRSDQSGGLQTSGPAAPLAEGTLH